MSDSRALAGVDTERWRKTAYLASPSWNTHKPNENAGANRLATRSGTPDDARDARRLRRPTTPTTRALGLEQDTKRWKDGYEPREAGAVPAWSDPLTTNTNAASNGSGWSGFGGAVSMGGAGLQNPQRQGATGNLSFAQSLSGSQPATPLDLSWVPALSLCFCLLPLSSSVLMNHRCVLISPTTPLVPFHLCAILISLSNPAVPHFCSALPVSLWDQHVVKYVARRFIRSVSTHAWVPWTLLSHRNSPSQARQVPAPRLSTASAKPSVLVAPELSSCTPNWC